MLLTKINVPWEEKQKFDSDIKTQPCHVQTEKCGGAERKRKCKQAESTLDAAETNVHSSSLPSFQPLDCVYVHKRDPQNNGTELQECILVAMAVILRRHQASVVTMIYT